MSFSQSTFPSLQFPFDGSNADVVTNLTPITQNINTKGPGALSGNAVYIYDTVPTGNSALFIDGGYNDCMDLGSDIPANFDLSTSNLFVEAWLYLSSITGFTQTIICRRNTSTTTFDWRLHLRNNNLAFNVTPTSGSVTNITVALGADIVQSQWFHVAASHARTGVSTIAICLFVNGVSAGEVTTSPYPPSASLEQPILIGSTVTGTASSFPIRSGYIQDLRVIKGGSAQNASFTPDLPPFSQSTTPTYKPGGTVVYALKTAFTFYTAGLGGQRSVYLNNSTRSSGTDKASSNIFYNTSLTTTSGLTLSVWLNFKSFISGSQGQAINLLQTPAGNQISIWNNGSGFFFSTPNGSTTFSLSTSINTWYYLAVTCSTTKGYTMYLNGDIVGSIGTYTSASFQQINLGCSGYNGSADQCADVSIQDLRIYNTAMDPIQIKGLYASGGSQGFPVSATMTGSWNSYTLPSVPDYTYIPFNNLPSSFTLKQTTTANVWGINSNQITDGGPYSTLTLVPSQPSDIYSTTYPGVWYRLQNPLTGTYVHHGGFVMWTDGYVSANYDYAWAFYLKNGTTDQIKIFNAFASGNWVQSGLYTPGRIAISTSDSALASVYTISNAPSMKIQLTGTPLLSQLSVNPVGAFSLRAVGGVTAKAVNVVRYPVVQWPPVAMISNATVVSGQAYGNGTYTATEPTAQSNTSTTATFRMFDNDINTFYEQNVSPNGVYTPNYYYNSGTSNVANSPSTTINSQSAVGWWVQTQSPTSFILRNYKIVGRQDNSYWFTRAPDTFWIAGSTDGSTWSNVDFRSGATYTQSGTNFIVPSTSNSVAYSYYRMVVSKLTATTDILNIASWNLYGDSPSYTTGSSDFYADRLGNLLTYPVSGTNLATWLGGAKGFVATWYDQSGKGKDATQTTQSNRPTITLDASNRYQMDFSVPSFFNATTGTIPMQTAYTVICRHNTIGNSIGGICGGGTNANSQTNSFRKNGSGYRNYWWGNDVDASTGYGDGNVVTFIFKAEASPTSGNTFIYSNGTTQTVTGNPRSGWSAVQGNEVIGRTIQTNETMQGQMYSLFLFNSALSDADRIAVENES